MALTRTTLDALDAAIASSTLEVELEGRRVRYRSTAELIAARAHVASVLAESEARQAAGASRASFHYQFSTLRGD